MHTRKIPQPSPYAHCPAHGLVLLPLSAKTLAAPMFSTWQSKNKSSHWANKATLHADRMDCIATQREFSVLNAYKPTPPPKSLGMKRCSWLHLYCHPSPSTLKKAKAPYTTCLSSSSFSVHVPWKSLPIPTQRGTSWG